MSWWPCLALFFVPFVAGCTRPGDGGAEPAFATGVGARPPHTVAFEDAEELAAWLRPDSPVGPLVSAHRGGPGPGHPENAVETFERALRFGPVLIECDVRTTRDGVPVLLHDTTLDRTTTGTGRLRERDLDDLRDLRLVDPEGKETTFRIPTLRRALAWAKGRAVLTLDVKRRTPPEVVVDAVRATGTEGHVVVIVYEPEDYAVFRRLAPDLVQSVSARNVGEFGAYQKRALRPERAMVFVGVGRFEPALVVRLRELSIRPILGTFGEIDGTAAVRFAAGAVPEEMVSLYRQGVGVLATDEVAAAAAAARAVREAGR